MPSETAASVERDAVTRILDAARSLFAEHGFDAVSMNAIAEAASVSKANIFHHFKSKDDLYLAVLKTACAASCDQIERFGRGDGPFEARLERYADEHLGHILDNEQITRLIERDLLENGSQRGRQFAEQVFGQNFGRLVEILREGQKRGELRADIDPALVALMVIGTNITFFQAREVFRHLPDVNFAESPETYSRMAMDIVFHGIQPRERNEKE
jgi:TetR/AcrR family transcriptional regulator